MMVFFCQVLLEKYASLLQKILHANITPKKFKVLIEFPKKIVVNNDYNAVHLPTRNVYPFLILI